jgi:hypothetical protein
MLVHAKPAPAVSASIPGEINFFVCFIAVPFPRRPAAIGFRHRVLQKLIS